MNPPKLDLHPSLDGYTISFVTRGLRGVVIAREPIAAFVTLAAARGALRAAEGAADRFVGGTTDAVSGFPGSLPAPSSKGQIR